MPAIIKQIIFLQFVPLLSLEGVTKDLMAGLMGNCVFCFPKTLSVPPGKAKEGLKETKLAVFLGVSH